MAEKERTTSNWEFRLIGVVVQVSCPSVLLSGVIIYSLFWSIFLSSLTIQLQ